MSTTNTNESAADGSSSNSNGGSNNHGLSIRHVDSTFKSNTVPIHRSSTSRLGSITNSTTTNHNVSSASPSPSRPISIPSNPSDIFLFKGFLPLDKNSFPSHYMFNCNTLEGIGFLPDQMFQLFAQILAYEYIRKGQTIPNSVMCGLTYFQEICTLRKRRIIPNEILPRERQITTTMGAPLHTIGSTNNLTFIQHVSSSKHPGVVSAKPISESPVNSNVSTSNIPPPQPQEKTSSSSSTTSQTPASTASNNPPIESNAGQSEKSSTTTTETNLVNSTTPPPNNDENSNSNLVTIDRAQQLTYRVVKPQPNLLETNLTLIGLEACSYLCDSFPEGNAKFKELLVTPIVNPHLPITNSSNNTSSSDTTSSSSTISEKQPEKAKENSPKIQKPIEVITVDDETPKKPLPTTKKTNNITTTNVTRPSRSKIITTPIRQLELSSSDEESPEVVAEENKKRKRKTITTKRKKKEKKTKKNHLGNDIYTVEKVLRKKIRESSEPEYLVKWQGYGEEDNSWVKESDMLDKALIQNFRGTVEYEKKSK
ncbi:chromodomain-containing protein [Naegleria gruberi]|uniref:Chromodomain-containing protein n=1 Tax=Naegleria gruberi TaxID=5762 RepID=D2VTU9_NAEGR|nr:chromodomain-containing protein [Naegleria gruberi]EFC39716.1 chromodomain-containing protein [Naegleria gruberi]|eukprot:XP_002672460.1 chromodomain-containing protein [Naegleria gruberi strain NEG-M]